MRSNAAIQATSRTRVVFEYEHLVGKDAASAFRRMQVASGTKCLFSKGYPVLYINRRSGRHCQIDKAFHIR